MEPNDNLIRINFSLLHYMTESINKDTQQKIRLSVTFEFRKEVVVLIPNMVILYKHTNITCIT
jgi:hypothetical protein